MMIPNGSLELEPKAMIFYDKILTTLSDVKKARILEESNANARNKSFSLFNY